MKRYKEASIPLGGMDDYTDTDEIIMGNEPIEDDIFEDDIEMMDEPMDYDDDYMEDEFIDDEDMDEELTEWEDGYQSGYDDGWADARGENEGVPTYESENKDDDKEKLEEGEDIISGLKEGDKIIINLTKNQEKYGVKLNKDNDEEVTVGKEFKTGVLKDKDFVVLNRKAGAPYTLNIGRLKKSFVKKI